METTIQEYFLVKTINVGILEDSIAQTKMPQNSIEDEEKSVVDVIKEEPEDISGETSDDDDDVEEAEEVQKDKIIIPSPKVSFDENDIPIIVKKNNTSFEERILEASADATAPIQLLPCDNCGRKFNQAALERHMKICANLKSIPRKVFDVAKKRLEGIPDAPKNAPKTPTIKKKRPAKPEDEYQTCEFCRRKFCPNAFDRHVTWCKEVHTRLQTSPVRDEIALAKLKVRTQYDPRSKTPGPGYRDHKSPSRKESLSSLYSEVSLPPWNLPSGRATPSYSSLTRADGNRRSTKTKRNISLLSGTKSLGRADGLRYLRQGDASEEPKEDYKPNAPTLSRRESGRGSIRKPALTKSSQLRQQAGDKRVDKEEKQRKLNEYGRQSSNFDFLRSRTPSERRTLGDRMASSDRMTRSISGTDYYRNERCRSKTVTPQLPRRQSPSIGRPVGSPYSWQSSSSEHEFKPVIKPSAYRPTSTSARAEPDGMDGKEQNSLSGEYDHSAQYDPFQSAERQMQELLFGTSSEPVKFGVQKPQPVRPSTNSAFSAYISPRTANTSSPSKLTDYKYSNLAKLPSSGYGMSKESSSNEYGTSKGPSDYGKMGSSNYGLTKMGSSRYGLGKMSSSDYGLGKMRSSDYSSSRADNNSNGQSSHSRNWTDLFPSLTRTPSSVGLTRQQQHEPEVQTMARFCHECGNPFPLPHIRFCCECGVKRLYC